MNAGEMRASVRVQIPEVREESGREITTWKDAFGTRHIMAKIRRRSAYVEKNGEGRRFAPDMYEITTRYTPVITSKCRLISSMGIYYVISSPTRSANGAWLTFTAERRDGAE